MYNTSGITVTQTQVIRHLARVASKHNIFNTDDIAVSLNIIRDGLVNDTIDTHTRNNFKYIVEHLHIASTPNYWLNHQYNEYIDSDWTNDQWMKLIDTQLNYNSKHSELNARALYDRRSSIESNLPHINLSDTINDTKLNHHSYTTIISCISLCCVTLFYLYNKYNKQLEYIQINDKTSIHV